MANQLDLEEQEKLDDLKHFWKQYGNLITWALIAVFGSIAAWNGWQHWQRSQATQAAVLYDEVERAAQAGDIARLERALTDIRDKFAGTAQTQQAVLLGAKVLYEKGKVEASRDALTWVAGKASDEGYQAVARLRLAAVLMEGKRYDEALAQLNEKFPPSFAALVSDRKGDVLAAQGKSAEARTAYQTAYNTMEPGADYRRLVEVKLNALGVDAQAAPSTAAASAAGTGGKP
ncbi:MAG: tetratricopeptide repeat protein [Pseudomonadota bacterium]